MKTSPIQLQQLSFRRVSVEVNAKRLEIGDFGSLEQALAFDNILISTHIGISTLDREDGSGPDYLLTLQVTVNDQPADDGEPAAPPPYFIHIEAGAIIRVTELMRERPDIKDIVVVNGTSLLWSAIREQVCNLTARMPPGLAMLPTVHFQDLRGSLGVIAQPVSTSTQSRKRAVARKV